MNDQLVPENDEEILDAFFELLSDIVPEGREEIETLLLAISLDPAKVRQDASGLIKNLREQTLLDWRNKQVLLAEARERHDKVRSRLSSDRQSLLDRLTELLADPGLKQAHAHYRGRKPEELSDEELKSFVHDLEFILEEGRSGRKTGRD